jgi:hypothetical protein
LGEDGLGNEVDCLGIQRCLPEIGSNPIYNNSSLRWQQIFRDVLK